MARFSFTKGLDDMLQNWQTRLEELRLQLALGEMDAADEFEELKKRYRKHFESFRKKLDEMEDSELVTELKTTLEKLRLQLALGRAESKDAFDEQKAKLKRLMARLRGQARKMAKEHEGELKEWNELLDDVMEHLSMHLDILRLQFHLGKAEAREKIREKRKEMEERMKKLNDRLEKLAAAGKEKWDEIYKDLSSMYNDFRSNMKESFSE
jgi:cytochrome c556